MYELQSTKANYRGKSLLDENKKKNMQQKTRQGCTLKNHNKTNVKLVMSNKVIL